MTIIREEDFIQSIADGFQYISCYHPPDYIKALAEAYEREESAAFAFPFACEGRVGMANTGVWFP